MSTSKYTKNDSGLFVCQICGETKARQNTMYYHMKKHAGIRDYKCEVDGCDKAFIQKSALTQHMLQAHRADDTNSETSESTAGNPYTCPFCPHNSAKTKANILIHIGRAHGDGWIPKMASGGVCAGDCKGKLSSSDTAYAYHAVGCFIDYAPDNIREILFERELIKQPLASQPVLSSTCLKPTLDLANTHTVE
jgi:hypothetical protein